MEYKDNGQLSAEYKKLLIDLGTTQQAVADAMGMTRQNFGAILRKTHLSFDDLARILAPLGYGIEFKFVKKVVEE